MSEARRLHRRNILVRDDKIQISGTKAAALSPLYFEPDRLKSKSHQDPRAGVNATSTTNALKSAAVSRTFAFLVCNTNCDSRGRHNFFAILTAIYAENAISYITYTQTILGASGRAI